MKKTLCTAILTLALFLQATHAQLFKVNLQNKVSAATLVAEGKVIAQKSFWNDAHTMIFTANTVELYKVFKGKTHPATIEVLTQGGSVGNSAVEVSDLLSLAKNQTGIFFCTENAINLKSPVTGHFLFDVYGSDQGFLRYDYITNKAFAPFASYDDIEGNLYKQVQQLTGQPTTVVNNSYSVAALVKRYGPGGQIRNGVQGLITSISPLVVHGGTLNDPTNNTLTISGSGFGNTPTGSCAVNFKDGNNSNVTPDYSVAFKSPYMISWSDTKIVLSVPSRASTGGLSVVLSDNSVVNSPQNLTVTYSVLNAEFDFSSVGVDTITLSEPRLLNSDKKGGYTYQFSNSTAGSGKSFAADAATTPFTSAIATWQQLVGAALSQGAATTTQAIKDDQINVVEYDNKNTGVPLMADGVLEATYSWFQTCYGTTPSFAVANAQKTGFDILVRNPGVSTGTTVSFVNGPCFPSSSGGVTYDLESVILHEIGHVLNLAHINDGYTQFPVGTIGINPGKVMHYAIVNYGVRRSPDNAAYIGALYTVTAQGADFGCPNIFELTQGSFTVISNDDCPGSFPATPTPPNTSVSFDLVHATSNMQGDPKYTQVDCQNKGESVTNNAYYALKTTSLNNGTLALTISNYATKPATLAACIGQGVRLAVYQATSCPTGQSFPAPVACATFTGNGALPDITGLLPNQTYLLYFDGLRNTKATFDVVLAGSALPIVLSKFSGAYVKGTDELYIKIEQAINVKSVIIEKSGTGYNFNKLGVLDVSPTQLVGNHTYVDEQPFAGSNYYRLKIMDNDGNVQYSNIVLLKNGASQLVYVYPNPVKDNLLVSLSGLQPGRYNFNMYDINGKALVNSQQPVTEYRQTISIPMPNMAKGIYLVKITNANGVVISQQKVLKQ